MEPSSAARAGPGSGPGGLEWNLERRLASCGRRFLFGDQRARVRHAQRGAAAVAGDCVPAKNHFREWRQYQNGYLRLIRQRGDAVTLQRRFQPGIQQTWLPELGVVDRCTTCHVGDERSDAGGCERAAVPPASADSALLTEFGCVMCHRGQGAATTVEEAHSSTMAWEQPILPARYLESSCGQCHQCALTGTPQLNLGRSTAGAVWVRAAATRIKLPDGGAMTPTDDPPSLTPHRRKDHARMDLTPG